MLSQDKQPSREELLAQNYRRASTLFRILGLPESDGVYSPSVRDKLLNGARGFSSADLAELFTQWETAGIAKRFFVEKMIRHELSEAKLGRLYKRAQELLDRDLRGQQQLSDALQYQLYFSNGTEASSFAKLDGKQPALITVRIDNDPYFCITLSQPNKGVLTVRTEGKIIQAKGNIDSEQDVRKAVMEFMTRSDYAWTTSSTNEILRTGERVAITRLSALFRQPTLKNEALQFLNRLKSPAALDGHNARQLLEKISKLGEEVPPADPAYRTK